MGNIPIYNIRILNLCEKIDLNNLKNKEYIILLLKKSGLFDEDYYLENYIDVAKAKIDPIYHYVYYGYAEYRNPTSWFDTAFYIKQNPEVQKSGVNPFFHYLRYGHLQGCKPNSSEF